MKTLLALSFFVLACPQLRAEEPAPKSGKEGAFFQRFFGPNFREQNSAAIGCLPRFEETTWPLYPQEKLPPGQTVHAPDLGSLPTGSYVGQTTYLAGDFVVTASGENRAILRPVDPVDPSIRLIAQYSATNPVPAEQTKITLKGGGGWMIRHVRKSADGQLNVYVFRAIIGP